MVTITQAHSNPASASSSHLVAALSALARLRSSVALLVPCLVRLLRVGCLKNRISELSPFSQVATTKDAGESGSTAAPPHRPTRPPADGRAPPRHHLLRPWRSCRRSPIRWSDAQCVLQHLCAQDSW
eukprot:COSAG03_NODE_1000_length_5055_cov_7.643606_4_plen_127_part_00